ncbi:putative D-lactate dehydrogenase (cytochrome) [Candidatus Hydrogenisulfobacillus filiaventi]|uniref:Putative D-lactate dehydrogenase (Cytochrome) n=1 Tax=Candidatus Hydrogenisulfobacillus filiaventi TaxID=2707344 RepID=A0A6F8ZCN5_9FIRM|nr:putative D-lactate dehydrogenase (cytochrome) [Candidatus Hydrogenisulfobacillus filiaventi]
MARLNRIRRIDPVSRLAEVEAGVVNADLQAALARYGLFYPPDPASHRISTLGGNLAENSGGPHCVRYGVTTHHVVELEVVLADGTRLTLPPARDWQPVLGDLTGVVVGSEGTLAVITAATVALTPLPPVTRTLLAAFPGVESALEAVAALIAARIWPATLELLDQRSVEMVERFVHAGYPVGAGAVLLAEVEGDPEGAGREADRVAALFRQAGALSVRLAADAAEAARLWAGRRAHYGAAARLAPHIWIQDVTVPRPALAAMMREALAIGDRYGLPVVTAAHAGDGNLHPAFPYDPEDPGSVSRLKAADRAVLEACVRLGGAITGEHGVGIDKRDNLPLMYAPHELALMRGVREVFDPGARRLNPGKALPDGPLPGPDPRPVERPPARALETPTDASEAADLIAWAAARYRRLAIRGAGTRAGPAAGDLVLSTRGLTGIPDFDPANLTVEVEAGVTAAALQARLAEAGLELPPLADARPEETVGGLVAARARCWGLGFGADWRDLLLAVEWVDGRGLRYRFGRKTMKNVAGYDLVHLAPGSRGRLGLFTRLTLRLLPRREPQAAARVRGPAPVLLAWALDQARARLRPAGLLLLRQGPEAVLYLRLAGPETPALLRSLPGTAGAAGLAWETTAPEEVAAATRRWHHLRAAALAAGRYREGGGRRGRCRGCWRRPGRPPWPCSPPPGPGRSTARDQPPPPAGCGKRAAPGGGQGPRPGSPWKHAWQPSSTPGGSSPPPGRGRHDPGHRRPDRHRPLQPLRLLPAGLPHLPPHRRGAP